MTTTRYYPQLNRTAQDGFERHVFSRLEHNDTGAVVTVKGTGTEDMEAPVLNMGYGVNYADNTNAEVFLVSLGSDTGMKFAIMSIPRDKQRKWEAGKGGIQHPSNPEKAIEFGDDGVWIKEGVAFLGDDKKVKVTIDGANITIEAGGGNIDFKCAKLTHNGVNIGDTHIHGGVETGSAKTLVPE